jgi:hypothetical protein
VHPKVIKARPVASLKQKSNPIRDKVLGKIDELINSLTDKMEGNLASNPDKPSVTFMEIPYVRRVKRMVKSYAGNSINREPNWKTGLPDLSMVLALPYCNAGRLNESVAGQLAPIGQINFYRNCGWLSHYHHVMADMTSGFAHGKAHIDVPIFDDAPRSRSTRCGGNVRDRPLE